MLVFWATILTNMLYTYSIISKHGKWHHRLGLALIVHDTQQLRKTPSHHSFDFQRSCTSTSIITLCIPPSELARCAMLTNAVGWNLQCSLRTVMTMFIRTMWCSTLGNKSFVKVILVAVIWRSLLGNRKTYLQRNLRFDITQLITTYSYLVLYRDYLLDASGTGRCNSSAWLRLGNGHSI